MAEFLSLSGLEEYDSAIKEYINEINNTYYIVTNYGITTDAEDNTPALQTLVDLISENGGGTIYFPVGTYNFKSAGTDDSGQVYAVMWKSYVSLVGENISKTILKQTEEIPYTFICRIGSGPDDYIEGCTFSNFTVDAYSTGDTWAVYGKAFFFQYAKNCVWSDLILQGTIATALGTDFIPDCHITRVKCIDCGRLFVSESTTIGTSGIGIGTGGYSEEAFTITDCVCEGCGQYGIFIEHQNSTATGSTDVTYARGPIISNCVCKNGMWNGFGIRGASNVIFSNCIALNNVAHGFKILRYVLSVTINNCQSNSNYKSGYYIEPTENYSFIGLELNNCTARSNSSHGFCLKNNNATVTANGVHFVSCKSYGNYDGGIIIASNTKNTVMMGCCSRGNSAEDFRISSETTQTDFISNGNAIVGTTNLYGTFGYSVSTSDKNEFDS